MVSAGKEKKPMTRTQRALLNKMDELLAILQTDWSYPMMSRAERREAERELMKLQRKFDETYE